MLSEVSLCVFRAGKTLTKGRTFAFTEPFQYYAYTSVSSERTLTEVKVIFTSLTTRHSPVNVCLHTAYVA